MNRARRATVIGAFVVGGLALILAAIIIAGGGRFFTRKERAVMYFSGSIYGLQVGAPVVFRGVRLGSVTSIGLVYDAHADSFTIPVVAELESNAIRGLGGHIDDNSSTPALNTLLARGLKASLGMQSLLTGQLYVDLDFRPNKTAQLLSSNSGTSDVEIPTLPSSIQGLKSQLEGMDFRKLLDDISGIAASAKALVGAPQLKTALEDLTQIMADTRRITNRLDRSVPRIADAAQATMKDASRALERLGTAADTVDDTARRLSTAADRASALLADDSAPVRAIQQAAEELARTASGLRSQTGEGAPLLQNADRTLRDVSRAARAVRELADLLERHPEALLRGRGGRDDTGDAGPLEPSKEARP